VSTIQAITSVCSYCGLPAPAAWWGEGAGAGPRYCCYGCRFAAAVGSAPGARPESALLFTRLGIAIFCTMNVMAFTMALWSPDIYGDDDARTVQALSGLFRYLSMFFAVPVFYTLGLPLAENAWDSLKRGIGNIDVLLIAGVAASFAVSVVSVVRDDGPIYFEVGCMVLVLVTIGRWLEAAGKSRASHALDALEKLLPEKVCVLRENCEVEKPLQETLVGELVRVRAGERIPCDGVLMGQPAHVDEQLLTGESAVRVKEPGDPLFAGTLNGDGDLTLRVTCRPNDGALARLVRLVRQAQQAKGRHEQLADRAARWFLPAVAAAALGALIYHGLAASWMTGVLAGLSVVLIACPCALGIATPLAMWNAIGQAARRRVLIHGGDVLERLARVDRLCFDKTGTLTTGAPVVADMILTTTADATLCRQWAVNLASASRHVHARAIRAYLGNDAPIGPVNVQTLPGRGLRADGPVLLGSVRWMEELGISFPDDLKAALAFALAKGQPVTCLAMNNEACAVFVFAEEWRPELDDALGQLSRDEIGVTILSGDTNLRSLPWEAHGGLLPEEKLRFLDGLRRQNKVVAMVGDGINDGPALAASDVGIAMGCGADVARDAAGICLLDNDLRNVPWVVELARKTVRVMKQNLAWAFVFNLAGIALACAGRLNPVVAALAMTISSLMVLGNSLRLGTGEAQMKNSVEAP
jgi:heavy metal translocating P-type ATPase